MLRCSLACLMLLPLAACSNHADKATKEWLYQDLEDLLNKKGLTCFRVQGGRYAGDQWFFFGKRPDDKGEIGRILSLYDSLGPYHGDSALLVTKGSSAKSASSRVKHIIDEEQKPAFAWEVFIFRGKQPALDKVRKTLPASP